LVCAARGDLHAAAGQYSEAIRLRPRYFEAQNNLGITRVQLGDVDRGIACFQEILRMKPDFAQAKANLSRATGIKQGRGTSP